MNRCAQLLAARVRALLPRRFLRHGSSIVLSSQRQRLEPGETMKAKMMTTTITAAMMAAMATATKTATMATRREGRRREEGRKGGGDGTGGELDGGYD